MEWGRIDLATIAVELRRTVSAVCMRARRLGLRRPTKSIPAFAKEHGYTVSRVRWAIKHSDVRLKRVPRSDPRQKNKRGHHFMLTEVQQRALLSFLRAHPRGERILGTTGGKTLRGVWGIGNKPTCCRECSTSARPHFAKGYCKKCYVKVYKWKQNRLKNPRRRPRAGSAPRTLFAA